MLKDIGQPDCRRHGPKGDVFADKGMWPNDASFTTKMSGTDMLHGNGLIQEPPPRESGSVPAAIHSEYIIYVDESGDHGLRTIDEKYPIFVLAFCVFHRSHYCEEVVPALFKIKFDYFGHDQVILHEREIRKEEGVFRIFHCRHRKMQFLGELSRMIDRSNFVLISCVIDKRALCHLDADSNPYHIALGFCLETLHAFLRQSNQHERKNYVVVECRGKKEDNELRGEFRRICEGNNRLAIPLSFELLFSDKKTMSPGLQLADLVARPIGLSVLRPEQENQAFNVLRCKLYCDDKSDGVEYNLKHRGLKIYPPQNCCPSRSERPR